MKNIIDISLVLKVMADTTRLQIIQMLASEQLCACHILEEFEFTQPTLSYHMKQLVDCGIVRSEKEGNLTRYKLNKEMLSELSDFFKGLSNQNESIRNMGNC